MRTAPSTGGASYLQIGKALSVSKSRAWRIVGKALDQLVEHCKETAGRVRQLELYRLDRYRLSLDSRKGDPRAVDTLIRISERVAKLHGLDAPQRIEASGPDGGPIENEQFPGPARRNHFLLRAGNPPRCTVHFH